MTAEDLLGAIKVDGDKNNIIKLATVTGLFPSGKPKLKFDGEGITSQKEYETLSSYPPQNGDRVLLLGVSGTWVILGKLGVYVLPDIVLPDIPPPYVPNYNNIQVTGTFRHMGAASQGIGFFGKGPIEQKNNPGQLRSDADTPNIVRQLNEVTQYLRELGIYR